MNQAERLLRNLDTRVLGTFKKNTRADKYHLNILLTRLFKDGYGGVINAMSSLKEGEMLIPEGMYYQSPIEHSERGNYWCDIYTESEYFRGWSYDPEVSLVRALLYYKIAEVKRDPKVEEKVIQILSSEPV